jgi:hypothetical protein
MLKELFIVPLWLAVNGISMLPVLRGRMTAKEGPSSFTRVSANI